MATAVIMPRQGQSVESCIITEWHKSVGDKVKEADILFSYETDKATFEEEAKVDGEILAIFFEEGDEAPCLANVCVIGEKGEDISEFVPDGAADFALSAVGEQSAQTLVSDVQAEVESRDDRPQSSVSTIGGRLKISPRARLMAEKNNVLLEHAVASGPGGRIIARDVQALIDGGNIGTANGAGFVSSAVMDVAAAKSEWEIAPLSNMRKVISKVMQASLVNSAQLSFDTSFDASDIFEFRKKLKIAVGDSDTPVASVTDIIVYATSRTLLKHKSLNAHFLDNDTMKVFADAHVALAVDTPRGLIVPTIFNASNMNLLQLAAESRRLQGLCQQGNIRPDFLQGASFTISNLGTMGVESFTPILNPPQTGILGVCSTVERLRNGAVYPAMGLSLTFDHRALDGADAARFLADLVKYLENFSVYAVMG